MGCERPTAYAAQASLFAMLAISLAWLWHSDAASELKAAALALGSLLATPYVLDYDLVVLALAIAFFAGTGYTTAFAISNQPACRRRIVPMLSRSIAGAPSYPSGYW